MSHSDEALAAADRAPARAGQTLTPATSYAIAALLFATYMLFAVAWRSGDFYVATLGLSASRTALLTNAITIAQVIGSLAAANVLLKLGVRKAFALSSILIILGFALALVEAYPIVFAIRFTLGLGGALTAVYLSAIVARVLSGTALQIANGVNSVAFNVGLAIVLTFAVPIGRNPQAAIFAAAAFSTVALVLWLVLSKHVPEASGAAADEESHYTMRHGFGDSFNWIFALAYAGLLSYYLVAFTFMDFTTVRWVVYAGVVGALSGTAVAAKTSNDRKPLVVVACAAAQIVTAALMLALSHSPVAAFIGVLLGLSMFFPMPFFVQLAFMRPGATPRRISVTFSIFWAVSYAVSVVILQIFGWITDATGGLGPDNTPMSATPLTFIVVVEGGFLVGALLLARYFRKARALEGAAA